MENKQASRYRTDIDNYVESIQAIIGFVNFYLYDDSTKTNRADVTLFQGRGLHPAASPDAEPTEGLASDRGDPMTPDLGVCLPDHTGVVGEVKLSFPKNQDHWLDDFKQLEKYGQDLIGWPTEDGTVADHDLVLLTHLTRSVSVRDFYYDGIASGTLSFNRPLVIIECSRNSQRKQFYFYRKLEGTLSHPDVNSRLKNGVPVPLEGFLSQYSVIKLYDAAPPPPYMMHLIWEYAVIPSVDRELLRKLKKRQKMECVLSVTEIIDKLREGYSFKLFPGMRLDNQPCTPRKHWVIDACERMVSSKDAEWIDPKKSSARFFVQKFSSTLEHFIDVSTKQKPVDPPSDRQKTLWD